MFQSYLKLGIEHILDIGGADHVLFLIALTVLYSIKEWRQVVILATAFTIGHSITLALSTLDKVSIAPDKIEFLIALTIFLAALFNLLKFKKEHKMTTRYLTALIFGFIHGMGFSNFFKSILAKDSIILPLFSFNIGVEIAQIIIVLITLVISWIIIEVFKIRKLYLIWSVSGIIVIWSLKLMFDRI